MRYWNGAVRTIQLISYYGVWDKQIIYGKKSPLYCKRHETNTKAQQKQQQRQLPKGNGQTNVNNKNVNTATELVAKSWIIPLALKDVDVPCFCAKFFRIATIFTHA